MAEDVTIVRSREDLYEALALGRMHILAKDRTLALWVLRSKRRQTASWLWSSLLLALSIVLVFLTDLAAGTELARELSTDLVYWVGGSAYVLCLGLGVAFAAMALFNKLRRYRLGRRGRTWVMLHRKRMV
jgi:hypothetical protein